MLKATSSYCPPAFPPPEASDALLRVTTEWAFKHEYLPGHEYQMCVALLAVAGSNNVHVHIQPAVDVEG